MSKFRPLLMTFPLIAIFFSNLCFATLRSPFAPTMEGVNIPNSHSVTNDPGEQAYIYRGMAPIESSSIRELKDFGIRRVLIFKNQVRNEVAREIRDLKRNGFSPKDIYSIPFKWKNFKSFRSPCEHTIEALKLLKKAYDDEESIFFHCTVGEDRTGYLAGIFRYLMDPDQDLDQLFQEELCERGYGAGDPLKPRRVYSAVRRYLTPLFLKMIFKVDAGYIDLDHLDYRACNYDPSDNEAFLDRKYKASKYKCAPQDI